MSSHLAEIILKYQTLIGSILGGLFALAVALIVAHTVRKREEVASGMVILGKLTAVRIAYEALAHVADSEKIPTREYSLWFSEKLADSHPSLSELFEVSVSRIMLVDVILAAHLSLFQSIYSGIEARLERFSQDLANYYQRGKPIRPGERLMADARIITQHFEKAVEHIKCSELLISRLILSRMSGLHRLRRYIWTKREEKECLKLLREGNS